MFEFLAFLENPQQYELTWRDGELFIARIAEPEPEPSDSGS